VEIVLHIVGRGDPNHTEKEAIPENVRRKRPKEKPSQKMSEGKDPMKSHPRKCQKEKVM